MTIAAECSQDGGRMIFNQIVKNPSCALSTTVQKIVAEALAEKFQELNRVFNESRFPDMSDIDYTKLLIREFKDEQGKKFARYPNLEWIDNNNPWSGILAKAKNDISPFFELRVNPDWLKEVWKNELNIDVDKDIDDRMQFEIDYVLEEMEIEVDPDYSYYFEWYEMISLDWPLSSCDLKQKKYKEIKSAYLDQVLSPIFDNYKNHLFYIASPDSYYFDIERPCFNPIIAGERIDGSHEITIFEGVN